MIIFGFGGGRRNDHGPALPLLCPNCHNQTIYRYIVVRKFFSLFFIPLIPYSSKHYLVCPICQRAVVLDGALKENAGRLVDLTARLQAGSISQEAYATEVRALGGGDPALPTPTGPTTPGTLPAPPGPRPDGFTPQA